MDYNDKYIYNKTNYINLKGGADEETIILVTHNARLRCFVTDISGQNNPNKDQRFKEIRFKNCCILKLTLRKEDTNAALEMIYSGSIEEGSAKMGEGQAYYVKNHTVSKQNAVPNQEVVFKPISFDIKLLNMKANDIKRDYNIYLIRHGEAEHNVDPSRRNFKRDTLLTPNGINQTREAADALIKYFRESNNEIRIRFYFCSELKRTRETMGYILEKAYLNKYKNENDKVDEQTLKMIVLPCAHEIKFDKAGKCDQKRQGIRAPENMQICRNGKIVSKQVHFGLTKRVYDQCQYIYIVLHDQNDEYVKKIKVNVDWKYYNNFLKENNCKKSNMIKAMIAYINQLKKLIEK